MLDLARIETVGYTQNNTVGYSNLISSDEFTKNEFVPQGACLTFCTGRFAVYKDKSMYVYGELGHDYNPQTNRAFLPYQELKMHRDVQNNFYLRFNQLNYKCQVYYVDWKEYTGGANKEGCIVAHTNDADYGMNVGQKGAFYDFCNFVTDFKYNNVCIVPRIARVVGEPVNSSTTSTPSRPYIYDYMTLKNFYVDGTAFPTLPSNLVLIGYTLIYDSFPHGWISPGIELRTGDTTFLTYNTSGGSIEIKCKDCYSIANSPSTYVNDAESNYRGVLLGFGGYGWYSRNYGQGRTALYIGPKSIEGINLIKYTECAIEYGSYYSFDGDVTYPDVLKTGYIPALDPTPFDSGLITLEDCVRMYCSLGLPIDVADVFAVYVDSAEGARTLADIAQNSGVSDEYLYYPVIGDNGQIDTEQYAKGLQEIQDTNIYKKTEDGENPFEALDEYDYNDIDTNTYVQSIELNTPTVTTVGVFNRMFALSREDIGDFANFIYTSNESQMQNMLDGLKLNGEKPMDFMIGLRQFPFNIRTYATVDDDIEIAFGSGVKTGVLADLIKDANVVLDLGSCTFRRYYKNFLDYEPYTTAKLYIPYCGEVPVSTAEFVGHEIHVKMIVDLYTGTCCAVVYRDEIPYMYVNGDIGADIMITGTDSWSYVENYKSMVLSSEQSLLGSGSVTYSHKESDTSSKQMSTIGGGNSRFSRSEGASGSTGFNASANALQVVGAGLSIANNVYDWANQGTPLYTSGTTSPLISFYKPQYCYFIIEQNLPMPVSDYGNSYGYSCMRKGKLSDYNLGTLVVAANYKGQPPNATLPETLEIKQLLESGVWR